MKSQNSGNQNFTYFICWLMERSGSGWPKNMMMLWIRIHNTSGIVPNVLV